MNHIAVVWRVRWNKAVAGEGGGKERASSSRTAMSSSSARSGAFMKCTRCITTTYNGPFSSMNSHSFDGSAMRLEWCRLERLFGKASIFYGRVVPKTPNVSCLCEGARTATTSPVLRGPRPTKRNCTGLSQIVDQAQASDRDFQPKGWAKSRNSGQRCENHLRRASGRCW